MAVSLNSVTSFNPPANFHQVSRTNTRSLPVKFLPIQPPSPTVRLSQPRKRSKSHRSLPNGDQLTTEKIEDESNPNKESPNPTLVNSPSTEGITVTTPDKSATSPTKRAPLTARERLRAARVLSRYNEPKPAKPRLGSNLLDSLRETDKGKKRPGLPEAPATMLDDSKRGLPNGKWSINIIPESMDLFLIVFSFVFISTVMFATTFLVWKVGAIHFNEN